MAVTDNGRLTFRDRKRQNGRTRRQRAEPSHIELAGLHYFTVGCSSCGRRSRIGRLPGDPPSAAEHLLCQSCRKKANKPASLTLTKKDFAQQPLLPLPQ
jgi:hypothetical protein